MFSTNFKGLGLPADLYAEFVSLFEYITSGNVTCENTLDGMCQLPGPCTDFSAYNEYYFMVNFTGANDGNYLRIPLATFAETVQYALGSERCNVNIQNLNSLNTQSSDIILGGMFFQEYFGVFTNDYSDTEDVT